jgi:phosphoglycolate phosphatase
VLRGRCATRVHTMAGFLDVMRCLSSSAQPAQSQPDPTAYDGHVITTTEQATWTVGFDLDMTLIDSRAGIKAVYDLLSAQTGVQIDSDQIIARLGPPVEIELANWFPPEQVQPAADRYRELYALHGIASARLLPGAHDAIAAVRNHGGRAVVVTGKQTANARLNLDALDLVVDEVFGLVFAEAKGTVLAQQRASIYVGDHLGDVVGAHAAGALAVGVATGPYTAAELGQAGAEVVLDDLTGFPAWLDGYLAR